MIRDAGTVDRAIREARRLQTALPNRRIAEALDAVMAASFADAQEHVPVESGALRASGRWGSNLRPGDSYLGRMAWGGEFGNPEVSYALYVYVDEPWLSHSYLYKEALEATIVRAISEEVR